jgi:hypothetical protein
LNELAAKQGVGPSTLARLMITQAIEGKESTSRTIDPEFLMKALAHNLTQVREAKTGDEGYQITAIDSAKAPVLVFSGQSQDWDRFSARLVKQLLSVLGIKVVGQDGSKSTI